MNTPAALHALAAAGVTAPILAADLGVHRTTVSRWARGMSRPSAANLAKLKTLIDERHRVVLAGNTPADHRRDDALRDAREALLTDAEHADITALAARLTADLEAYLRRPATDPFPPCVADAA